MQRKVCETDCGNESIHCYTTYAGNLIVYASDPWYEAAKASFYDIDYEILPTAAAVNAGKTSMIVNKWDRVQQNHLVMLLQIFQNKQKKSNARIEMYG